MSLSIGMNGKLTGRTRTARTASIAILLISFLAPFIWALATSLIWDAGKNLSSSASDTAISFPTGLPLLSIIFASWLTCFSILQRIIHSIFLVTLLSNAVAVLAFCICFTLQIGATAWNPMPAPGLINIFPVRFVLAVVLAFACSAFAAIYLARRPGN